MWTLEGSGVQISAGGQLPEAVELVPGDPWLRALLLHYTHNFWASPRLTSGMRHSPLRVSWPLALHLRSSLCTALPQLPSLVIIFITVSLPHPTLPREHAPYYFHIKAKPLTLGFFCLLNVCYFNSNNK